jgi:hypothetical protein
MRDSDKQNVSEELIPASWNCYLLADAVDHQEDFDEKGAGSRWSPSTDDLRTRS